MLVRSLGYEPITVSDPAHVLETAEREQPAVLLQDLKMPDLNLSGLVACLRLSPATDDMPIVFASAVEDISDHASRYDAWGYLSKPFGKEELDRVLEEAIHGGPVTTDREPRREVRRLFHDQWNLLAAIGNYIDVMQSAEQLPADVEQSVAGLEKTVLQLEARTERMQSYLFALLSEASEDTSSASERDRSDALAGA